MKKTNIILLIFILSNISLLSQFSGGNGTAMSPYRISSRQDMEDLADSVKNRDIVVINGKDAVNWSYNKYFKLTNDIRDSVRTFIGSRTVTGSNSFFQGSFDGQGYKITLAINYQGNEVTPVALFSHVSDGANIRNIVVDGYAKTTTSYPAGIVNIIGYFTSNSYAQFDVIVKNCVNLMDIKTNIPYIAGIVRIISSSVNKILINSNIKIEDCINLAQIDNYANNNYNMSSGILTGGYVYNENSTYSIAINRCINAGYIFSSNCAGGIFTNTYIDKNGQQPTITKCLNTGVVRGGKATGGIMGYLPE